MYYIVARTFTIRLPESTVDHLRHRAERAREAPRALAQRYIEEGLRVDEHPLVRFADGPMGRRAALIGTGLDVWEVVATIRDNDGDPEAAAAYLEKPVQLVQAAVAYYGAYPAEIDRMIERNQLAAEEAHAAWIAGRDALRR